jgi:hypothetical protein
MTTQIPGLVTRLATRVLFGAVLVAAAIVAGPHLVGATNKPALQTRAVSCYATAFRPIDSNAGYTIGGANILYWTGGGSSNFECNPVLPQHAMVTRLAITSADYVTNDQMGLCRLERFPLVPSQSLRQTMATVPGTGVAFMGGRTRRSTKHISHAAIDNQSWAYAIDCTLPANPSAGLYGASVTFQISAANG